MKKVIWRPKAVSRTALLLIAVLAGVGIVMVERYTTVQRRAYYQDKLKAAELANKAFQRIERERTSLGPEIEKEFDPTESGIIGVAISTVTSNEGHLEAKQTSINCNFAAVVVDMLKRAGVEPGDAVGVGCSGSFPALNICTYAALETLGAKPIPIASATGSQWGANVPELMWTDMERILHDEGYFTTRSLAVSKGGVEDQVLDLDDDGKAEVQAAIDRSGLTEINAATFAESIQARMDIYDKVAGPNGLKCYINVGGGAASVGTYQGKMAFQEGLNLRPPKRLPKEIDGIMPRLARRGVPIIHLVQVASLAERYGLDPNPQQRVAPGTGGVFQGEDYNKPLAAIVLAVVVLCLFGFIRSDIGFRLLQGGGAKKQTGHPEPMV